VRVLLLRSSAGVRARRLTKLSSHDAALAGFGPLSPRRPLQSMLGADGVPVPREAMLTLFTRPAAVLARLPCSMLLVPSSPFRSSVPACAALASMRRATPAAGPLTVVS